ncbi:MAG: alginate export family protein [Planctomycetota bacterium]|nr:MAG: alginate export family protein [Planctomycetota bacterium]
MQKSIREKHRQLHILSSTSGKLILLMLLAAATTVCTTRNPANAQARPEDFLNRQRMLEDQVREALDRELPGDRAFELDWGGWYSYYMFLYDDGIESSRTYRRHDLRLWGSMGLDQGAHQFYGRLKLQYEDFNSGDSYDGNDDDWIGPNLDRGFYQFDLRKAVQAYRNKHLDWNLKLKVGRDLVEFGTGYAFSTPLDHVMLTLELGDWEIDGLAATAIRSYDNIDQSHPNSGNSERNFWGTQITYNGFEKHRPFAYAYWNEDQLTEKPISLFQNYDYDTWYVGIGSAGELVKNLRYGTEWVLEGGNSYGDRSIIKRDDVHAWAFDIELEYLSQLPLKPRFGAEYMFASGDPNRLFSPTNAAGGNFDHDDTGFVGFGYRDTGLSFAPILSNIHIWRTGAAFIPFEDIEALKELEVGTDWFLYWKNRTNAAVSDPTADRQSGYLGWEMDYFLSWRITSDLSWTTRFGTFFPGRAFSDQTTRTFLLMGVTWSF